MSASQKHLLHVSNRIVMGQKVSQLRKTGQTIANIFGEETPSQAISLNRSVVLKYLKAEGDSGLVYLVAEDKIETPVLIEEIQYDAVTSEPLHISFKRVNLKEKVQSEVPVELIGEVSIPGANVILVKDVLEVEALPTDLPEQISIDISGLTEIGQSLNLSNAIYDRDKVTVLLSEESLDEPLVIVQEVKEEVEEVPVEVTEAEGAETAAAGDATPEAETETKE